MPINGVCYCGGEGWDGCEPHQSAPPPIDSSVFRAAIAADHELMPGLFDSIWGDWLRTGQPLALDPAMSGADGIDPRLLTPGQRLSLPSALQTEYAAFDKRTVMEVSS